VQGNPKVIDTLEVAEVKEFTIEQLPLGNLSHDHDRQLQDYLNGATVIA
jgi:8-oxo-dGTP diphosphatase